MAEVAWSFYVSAVIAGAAFGYVIQRGGFCLMRALSNLFLMGDATIARAYAKENILAYIVAPGVVRTRLSENFAATQGGEAAVTANLAMGEWVPPSDIAELVAFLATGRCRHLIGATLDVNGASYVR
jgi:NAD(P)-dependent dehydrogenase (short-subunit alcohol dehydrogenase family)